MKEFHKLLVKRFGEKYAPKNWGTYCPPRGWSTNLPLFVIPIPFLRDIPIVFRGRRRNGKPLSLTVLKDEFKGMTGIELDGEYNREQLFELRRAVIAADMFFAWKDEN
jgi:hypothetical protein